MKFWLAATCVIIVFAGLFDSFADAGLTDKQKKFILKIIALLFDKDTIGENFVFTLVSKDLKLNQVGAETKYDRIKARLLFGFNGKGIVKEIRSSQKYLQLFLEIFPENRDYMEEEIIQILETISAEQVVKLGRLLFLLMGEGEQEVELPMYSRLVQILVGVAAFTRKELVGTGKIFEKVKTDKQVVNWTWAEFKGVNNISDLADLGCGDSESFQTPEQI